MTRAGTRVYEGFERFEIQTTDPEVKITGQRYDISERLISGRLGRCTHPTSSAYVRCRAATIRPSRRRISYMKNSTGS